jgi:hypothetical protein
VERPEIRVFIDWPERELEEDERETWAIAWASFSSEAARAACVVARSVASLVAA